MLVWALVVCVTSGIYWWFTIQEKPFDSPEYQESIRRHATGDRAEDLIRFLDSRPTFETIE